MLVAHLDADCFYVSAERVRAPFLRGKLVGVIGNQGACVIAKSYEMKAKGVATGEPIWDAMKKCPDGIYVKRDFRWYEVLSREMLSVVREWSSTVEYYSIDEFFLSVERGDPQRFAEEIRERINASVRVAEQRVTNAVGVWQYSLTDVDRGFLALAKTWKRKNPV